MYNSRRDIDSGDIVMYKMIMIDDEIEARNRIENIIDFEKLGFEGCGLYENALDALDYIELYKDIDLVVTDIKMPFMDGLQLSMLLHEKYPLIKVVIITGFDEFDYAKKALECGVIGYVMKPVTSEDFSEILTKSKNILDEEKTLYNNISELENYKIQSKEYFTSSTLDILIKEPINDYVLESISFLDLDFHYKYYQVFTILLRDKKTLEELEYYETALKKVITETLDEEYKTEKFMHKNKFVVILKCNNHFNIRRLDVLINEILLKMNKYYSTSLYIGVSNEGEGIDSISLLYHQSNHALMHKNLLEMNSVYYYSTISKSKLEPKLEEDFLNNLRFFIRYKTMDKIREELKRIHDEFIKINTLSQRNYLLLDFSISLMKCSSNPDQLIEQYGDIYEHLQQFKVSDELFEEILKIIEDIRRINDESLKKGFSSTVDEIISYIENNYSNPEINLNTLAEEMDLSVSYICAILKKERNETFVKILTDTRMNKAKELLQNPENKIIDIAEKVGFFEPYYFSHTFKKATGYSPKEYRSLCQKE